MLLHYWILITTNLLHIVMVESLLGRHDGTSFRYACVSLQSRSSYWHEYLVLLNGGHSQCWKYIFLRFKVILRIFRIKKYFTKQNNIKTIPEIATRNFIFFYGRRNVTTNPKHETPLERLTQICFSHFQVTRPHTLRLLMTESEKGRPLLIRSWWILL